MDIRKANNSTHGKDIRKVYMHRHMGLIRSLGVVVGSVIGTGIFLSPSGVAFYIGSVGGILLIWTACGIINALGAVSFTELGAMMPEAGGHYAFIYAAYGPAVAFSCVWAGFIMASGAGLCIFGRTAAVYLLSLLDPVCGISPLIIDLTSIFLICTVAYLNCLNIEWATRVQTIFSFGKVIALLVIIITGIYMLASGNSIAFSSSESFKGTNTDFGSIALAIYAGYFAYNGWESLFLLQEEVKNPEKTLPRAILIGMTIITAVYVMTNMAYLTVMTPIEVARIPSTALTFAARTLNSVVWLVSVCVALSASSVILALLLRSSRELFRCGRDKTLPGFLGMLDSDRNTPVPATICLVLFSFVYHLVADLPTLMGYIVFGNQLRSLIAISTLFYFRIKRPDAHRPIKIPLVIPAVVFLLNGALLVMAVIRNPTTYGIALGIFCTFLPAYLFNIFIAKRQNFVSKFIDIITLWIQQFLMVVPENRTD